MRFLRGFGCCSDGYDDASLIDSNKEEEDKIMDGDGIRRKKPKCMCGLMGLGLGGFIISVCDVVIATALWIGLFTTERKEHFELDIPRWSKVFLASIPLLMSLCLSFALGLDCSPKWSWRASALWTVWSALRTVLCACLVVYFSFDLAVNADKPHKWLIFVAVMMTAILTVIFAYWTWVIYRLTFRYNLLPSKQHMPMRPTTDYDDVDIMPRYMHEAMDAAFFPVTPNVI